MNKTTWAALKSRFRFIGCCVEISEESSCRAYMRSQPCRFQIVRGKVKGIKWPRHQSPVLSLAEMMAYDPLKQHWIPTSSRSCIETPVEMEPGLIGPLLLNDGTVVYHTLAGVHVTIYPFGSSLPEYPAPINSVEEILDTIKH